MRRAAIVGFASATLIALVFATTAQAGFSITYPQGPDPAVGEWPGWPHPVSCGGLSFDPVAAFDGPTEAATDSGAPELALRAYLDANPSIPKHFWRLVIASETRAEFANGRLPQGPLWLSFELANGEWAPAGLPQYCVPRTVREGLVASAWTLAPGQRLASSTRRVRIELAGEGCNGGRSEDAMARRPEFTEAGRKLAITVWLEPLPLGIYTCQKLIEPPLVVRLPGRLGHRRLYDGRTYPPRLRQ